MGERTVVTGGFGKEDLQEDGGSLPSPPCPAGRILEHRADGSWFSENKLLQSGEEWLPPAPESPTPIPLPHSPFSWAEPSFPGVSLHRLLPMGQNLGTFPVGIGIVLSSREPRWLFEFRSCGKFYMSKSSEPRVILGVGNPCLPLLFSLP